MQKRIKNRILMITGCILLCAAGVSVILYNLNQHIIFFYPPSKLTKEAESKEIRVGGMVKAGSISRLQTNTIEFVITDYEAELTVSYKGILPALFREGQGIVAQGRLVRGVFMARSLLAKHDENYMPPGIKTKSTADSKSE